MHSYCDKHEENRVLCLSVKKLQVILNLFKISDNNLNENKLGFSCPDNESVLFSLFFFQTDKTLDSMHAICIGIHLVQCQYLQYIINDR